MPEPRNQDEVVKEKMKKEALSETVTERVNPPGLKEIHKKSFAEAGEFLANVLKSRRNVTRIVFQVGEYVELTYERDAYRK